MSTEDTGAPNLDCLPLSELIEWAAAIERDPRGRARELFPKRPSAFVIVTKLLRDYALTKAAAMESRLAGNIVEAVKQERRCESMYGALPRYARW